MIYPLVLDLADDGIPVAVACRVLGFSKQAFFKWRKEPVPQRDWDDAHLTNAAINAHRDDPAFGYRFIADELREAGLSASERRIWRLCSQQRLWSTFSKKRGLNRKPGPPVHDDRVQRAFTAPDIDKLWLTDITEHQTSWIPAVVATGALRSGDAGEEVHGGAAAEVIALIDRGGSIRAAAVEIGVHPDAGYKWMRQAGLSTSRSTQRRYSPEQKDEFFRRLAVVKNVSAVARELAINRVTCFAWAHKAGIFTSTYSDAKRQEFLRLRGEGVSRREAAERLGIEGHQASDWDKGIRVFSKGRIYPDGRVVLYSPAEVLAHVKKPRTAWHQGEHVDLARVEQVIDARYLSLTERERLKDLQQSGLSIRAIARELSRAPSTISRELKRNTVSRHGYLPHTAHRASVKRRERPKTAKLAGEGPLRDYVAAKLKKRWSPEQISRRVRRDFPHDDEMRVSCETIYQAVYVHAHGELKRELARSLRRGRSRRKPQAQPDARRNRFTDPMTRLAQRPTDADDRALPGHWEGDLIVGTANGSTVATLVERTTRYTLLGHLPVERTAEAVRDSLIAAVSGLPVALRRTLTWDQGAEMAEHRAFATATDMAVYFCDPASPWQRGTKENTNGLLRQYLPRRSDLRQHSAADLTAIAEELNGRPRKALDWDTPAERFAAILSTA